METFLLWLGFRKHWMLHIRTQVIQRSETWTALWALCCCRKGQQSWMRSMKEEVFQCQILKLNIFRKDLQRNKWSIWWNIFSYRKTLYSLSIFIFVFRYHYLFWKECRWFKKKYLSIVKHAILKGYLKKKKVLKHRQILLAQISAKMQISLYSITRTGQSYFFHGIQY